MNADFCFKQFNIAQNNAGFKVGTDACLLGAWVDTNLSSNVLDIGTGSGVISLMLAQRTKNAKITGIDIDPESAKQAEQNFKASKWKRKLKVVNKPLQTFEMDIVDLFDTIVCNPPFFSNSTKNKDERQTLARHDYELPLKILLSSASRMITDKGRFSIVYPADRENELISEANEFGWQPYKILRVRPKKEKDINRILCTFVTRKVRTEEDELVLYESNGDYTPQAIKLLKPFYLKL